MGKLLLYLKNFDWLLFFAVFLLSCFGLIEIYSIALGRGAIDLLNFEKQIVFIILGIISLFVFSFLDYNFLKNSAKYLYALSLIALAAVLFLGSTINGTRGWFAVVGLGLQPSEFAKIVLILFLAYFFSSRAIKIRSLKQFVLSGAAALLIMVLIFLQPDFGSALVFFAIWLIMLFWAGFNKKYFISMVLILILLVGGMWTFYFKDYQKQRILTFVAPRNRHFKPRVQY